MRVNTPVLAFIVRSVFAMTLSLACASLAEAQSGLRDEDYLRYYPSAEKVRADIVASARDARPEEIEGRVEGRLRTLSNALKHTWKSGYRNRETGLPIMSIGGGPPAARKLNGEYEEHYAEIYRHAMGEYPDCSFFASLLHLAGFHHCELANYRLARDAYDGTRADGQVPAAEVAALYFPEVYRERFVDLSGADVEYNTRGQRLAGVGGARGASGASEAKSLEYMAIFALVLCVVFVLLGILATRKVMALKHEIRRYEFENRTSGGVVQFTSYEAMLEHERKKDRLGLKMMAASIPFTLAFFSLLWFFSYMVRP